MKEDRKSLINTGTQVAAASAVLRSVPSIRDGVVALAMVEGVETAVENAMVSTIGRISEAQSAASAEIVAAIKTSNASAAAIADATDETASSVRMVAAGNYPYNPNCLEVMTANCLVDKALNFYDNHSLYVASKSKISDLDLLNEAVLWTHRKDATDLIAEDDFIVAEPLMIDRVLGTGAGEAPNIRMRVACYVGRCLVKRLSDLLWQDPRMGPEWLLRALATGAYRPYHFARKWYPYYPAHAASQAYQASMIDEGTLCRKSHPQCDEVPVPYPLVEHLRQFVNPT